MPKSETKLNLLQWKERARDFLSGMAEALYPDVPKAKKDQPPSRPRIAGKEVVFVFDPIKVTFDDGHGGVFTCTYDIRGTLASLSKRFQEMEDATEDEVAAYASSENISFDDAMAMVDFRYVEAEIFSRAKAGRFLHEQLGPALKEVIGELIDEAFLHGLREYGAELVEPARIFEEIGRKHIKRMKQRSGLVPKPGRPPTWTRQEVIKKVTAAMSKQQRLPALRRTAKIMNYGGLSGGEDALRKLLKKHKINWRELKDEWKKIK